MKKKIVIFMLAALTTASIMLSGCGRKSGTVQEYKEQGISQMAEGDYAAATESFQSALDQSRGKFGADERDISFYKALAQYKAGDIQKAVDTYSSMIAYDEENWETYYLRGNLYLEEGQIQSAISDYEKAVQLNEGDIRLYLNLYENLSAAGEADFAKKYEEAVLLSSPSKAEEHYYVGKMFYLTGDYDNAAASLNSAAEGGYDDAFLLLGRTYAAQGKEEEAQAAFTSYMEKYPTDPTALNELGVVAMSVDDYESAVDYLETALSSAEGDIMRSIQRNLIAAYEYSGDFRKAYSVARELASKTDDEEVKREYEFLRTRISYDNQSATTSESEEESTIEGTVIPESGE